MSLIKIAECFRKLGNLVDGLVGFPAVNKLGLGLELWSFSCESVSTNCQVHSSCLGRWGGMHRVMAWAAHVVPRIAGRMPSGYALKRLRESRVEIGSWSCVLFRACEKCAVQVWFHFLFQLKMIKKLTHSRWFDDFIILYWYKNIFFKNQLKI